MAIPRAEKVELRKLPFQFREEFYGILVEIIKTGFATELDDVAVVLVDVGVAVGSEFFSRDNTVREWVVVA